MLLATTQAKSRTVGYNANQMRSKVLRSKITRGEVLQSTTVFDRKVCSRSCGLH